MKPLLVLFAVFLISLFSLRFQTQKFDVLLSARIGMCVMLIFTALGHFAFTKGMTMMIPSLIPLKKEIIYFTGILEILLGIGLLIPSLRIYSAWGLIVFFLILLPANIYATIHHIDYQKGTFDGNGITYLWFRIPLQILFIVWTFYCSIKVWR